MNQDSELPLASLRVDGGMTVNHTLLQLQADLLGIPVGEGRERGGEGDRPWVVARNYTAMYMQLNTKELF